MDFYILLGVEPAASASEIKRAYRRLARRLHPDINPGDEESARQFQRVLDAYETLMDPDRRRRYDSGALQAAADSQPFGFAGFDFSRAPDERRATTFGELFEDILTRRPASASVDRGADLHQQASLSFEEAWRGMEWPVSVTRHALCGSCGGAGVRHTAETRCPACDGAGTVRSTRGHMVFSRPCTRCAGAGRLKQQPCETCAGQGVEARAESFTVRLPAGIADGMQVRVPERGHAAPRGGRPGDFFLTVHVRPHATFSRVGDDVHMVVPIAVHEAALGARIEVPTPDGPARLRVPPGTQSGQRFRLRERGAPSRRGGRGDLVAELRVTLPRQLDERSKELLREFGRLNAAAGEEERRTKHEERRTELGTTER